MFRAMFRARPRWRTGVLAAGAVLLAAGVLSAGGTQSFRQTTAKDFEEGEATASVILPSGELVPGLAATRLAVEAAFVWSSAVSPDGRTAYFGTGDQGRLYAVTLRQGSSAPAVRKLCDLGSPWITSLAVRPDGTLVVGSTPGGRVFTVDPGKPEPRQLARLGAEHVWSLAHDARTGVTYAGTGGAGKVFAIDAKGAARQVWDSGDKQVVSLLSLGGGTLLAGTAVEGVLYRVHPDGRGEALHDFDADEVRAILRTASATYVAVNDFVGGGDSAGPIIGGPPSASGGGTASPAAKGTRITLGGPTPPASAGGLSRPTGARGRGAVYRLDDSGAIEQVFALSDGYLTALLADRNGDVLAAAGTQGKVYRLLPDRTFALAADLSERQALTLVRTGDGFLVGTGDVGGVYEVRPASAGQANYLSRVFDGDFFSAWGRLRWSGSDNLAFETRSGNTAKPDRSWSGWKKLEDVKAAAGSGVGEGRVASNASRYVQYRLTFPPKGGALKEVQLYYLPQNQRPRVTDVYLSEGSSSSVGASAGGAAAASVAGGGSARAHASMLKLRWKVENPDGDNLIYRLGYRQEREAVWRPLGGGDPLTKAEFDWNTDSVPDGSYLVRVWVTDERSNSSERALDSTFVSAPFLVDNTRPEIRDLSSKSPVVTGRALDAASVVSQVEFSVDGEEWRPVTPRDGLLDQKSEEFVIRLPTDLSRGPHVVNVRAWDAADNLGAGRIQVETK